MKITTTETSNGKLVHTVYDYGIRHNALGYEEWKTYDTNNNEIHWRDSTGYEIWRTYDSNNNLIHCRNSDGYEHEFKQD